MKAILMLMVISFSLSAIYAQKMDTVIKNEAFYMHKFEKQRKTGSILAIAGGSMMGAGLLTGIILMTGASGDNPEDEVLVGLGLFGVGFYTALASLPFFIAASVNKKKASQLVLQYQPVVVPTANGLSQQTIPAVSLKIPINTRGR
jgi:hypothetical protein